MPSVPGPDATEAKPARSVVPAARSSFAVCAVIGAIAFLLYNATLLPGLDFGDTASFQAEVGERDLTPRQAYPLYYAIGNAALALTGAEPAHALNLVSAIAGAFAVAIFVWVAIDLTGSRAAGAVGGLWLASSYTFWTQAIIAEVYTLHLALMGLVLAAILWWDRRPSLPRLSVVFALYALAFGNHLMSILLLPALVLFIATAPGGLRILAAPQTIAMGALCAIAGASQYLVERLVVVAPARCRVDPFVGRSSVLVRRHEIGLARHDDLHRASSRPAATAGDVPVRAPATAGNRWYCRCVPGRSSVAQALAHCATGVCHVRSCPHLRRDL